MRDGEGVATAGRESDNDKNAWRSGRFELKSEARMRRREGCDEEERANGSGKGDANLISFYVHVFYRACV